jgi:hypothetical protein
VGEIRPQSPSGSHIQATAKQRFTSWNFVVNHVTLYHTRPPNGFFVHSAGKAQEEKGGCASDLHLSSRFHTKPARVQNHVYTFSVVMNPFYRCVCSAALVGGSFPGLADQQHPRFVASNERQMQNSRRR